MSTLKDQLVSDNTATVEKELPKRRDRRGKATDDTDSIEAPPRVRGYRVRRIKALAKRGFYSPKHTGAPSTTRQSEVLNTALIGSPTDEQALVIGRDRLSGATVAHDGISAYKKKLISSANAVLIGILGSGKSSLIKTVYVARQLTMRKRRAVVFDKKPRTDGTINSREEGEYAELTRHMGSEPFRLEIGGDGKSSTVLNILDPVILQGGGSATQQALLVTMAELSGSNELNEFQLRAVASTHNTVLREFENKDRVPVLEDFVTRIDQVPDLDEFKSMPLRVREEFEMAAWQTKFMFERMLTDELAGLFDGETSKHVSLNEKLTTFDISALPEDGPSVSMVMAVGNAWLLGMLRKQPGWNTSMIAEEGWYLTRGSAGKLLQSNAKLSRALGLQIVTAFHHLSDIPRDSAAISLIQEAQTAHLFKQEHEHDMDEIVRLFGIDPTNADALRQLRVGEHFLKVGTKREIRVEHVRSELETMFTDTDAGMNLKHTDELVGAA